MCFSHQSRHVFVFIVDMIEILLPICTLTWRANNYVSRQEKGMNSRNEVLLWKVLYNTVQTELNNFCSTRLTKNDWKLFFIKRRNSNFVVLKNCLKTQIIQSSLLNFSPKMATLRNKRKLAAVSRRTQKYPRNSQSQNTYAPWNNWGVYSTSFWRDWGQSHQKTVPGNQLDRVPHLGCSAQIGRISVEPTGADILQNRSRNILEDWRRKPGTKWGSFPEWSPSWKRFPCLSCQQPNWLRSGPSFWHGDRSSKRNPLLLPWDFFKQTKGGALRKSA